MNERIHWIDLTKGIAMVLVVIVHVVSSYYEAGLFLDNHLFSFLSQFIYSFHMPLFMLISGFLFAKKNTKSKAKQVVQILNNYGIPYVLFSVIWVGMKLLMSQYTNSPVSIHDLLLIPMYPISFMWFIYALMIMQIVQILIGSYGKIGKCLHLLTAWGVLHSTIFSGNVCFNKVSGLYN